MHLMHGMQLEAQHACCSGEWGKNSVYSALVKEEGVCLTSLPSPLTRVLMSGEVRSRLQEECMYMHVCSSRRETASFASRSDRLLCMHTLCICCNVFEMQFDHFLFIMAN